jgi:hypothetical protein
MNITDEGSFHGLIIGAGGLICCDLALASMYGIESTKLLTASNDVSQGMLSIRKYGTLKRGCA